MFKDKTYVSYLGAFLLGILSCIGCAFETGETDFEKDIVKTQIPVQWNYLYESENILRRARVFHNMTASQYQLWVGQATGNIVIEDETYLIANVKGSCGATFISPHYAVTSAHCVNGNTIDSQKHPVVDENTPVYIIEYAVGPNLPNLGTQAGVNTVYPNQWANWTRQGALDANDDYSISRINECYVRVRCDDFDPVVQENFGPNICYGNNCPCAYTGVDSIDIALLYCINNRPSEVIVNGQTVPTYVLVSPNNQYQGGVNIFWFHEVIKLPTSDSGDDRWTYYGHFNSANYPANFHYEYNTGDHQRLPILSETFYKSSNNTTYNYKVTDWTSTYSKTNAFGCHGTSGSGVFETGLTFLLGPADHPQFNWGMDLLCAGMQNFDSTGAPEKTISFPSAEVTRNLQNRSEVQLDAQ